MFLSEQHIGAPADKAPQQDPLRRVTNQVIEKSDAANVGEVSVPVSDGKPPEEEEEKSIPSDEALAKAWTLMRKVPAISLSRDIAIKRLHDDMMRGQLRVTVDLPWFINVGTVVPPQAWPDHKSISKFWRDQGNMGWRPAKGAAPTTAEFKSWLMQRLRVPQSGWSVNRSMLFNDGARVFQPVHDRYALMLSELAAKRIEPPEIHPGATFNVASLAKWLRDQEDDEGIGWLIAMASHWPNAFGVEKIFEALDGAVLGPMARCALEYLNDCCEIVLELCEASPVKRRAMSFTRKRSPHWQESYERQNHSRADTAHAQKDRQFLTTTPSAVAEEVITASPSVVHESSTNEIPVLAGAAGTAANALVHRETIVQCLSQLEPGSTGFEPARQQLLAAVDSLCRIHEQTVRQQKDAALARKDQEEAERVAQQQQLAREERLREFFHGLESACDSIPEEVLSEPVQVQGSLEVWLPGAMEKSSSEFDSWARRLDVLLAAVSQAASQMVAAAVGLDRLDTGHDERLTNLGGIALRQLKHKLQEELLSVAHDANLHLAHSLSEIGGMNPYGTVAVTPPATASAEGIAVQPEVLLADEVAEQAVNTSPAIEANGRSTMAVTDTEEDKIAETSRLGSPLLGAGGNNQSGQDDPPVLANSSQSDTPASVVIAPSASMTNANDGMEKGKALPPGATDDMIDTDLNDSDSVVVAVAVAVAVAVDNELDLQAFSQQVKRLQRAADDRLWKLTRVGVAALPAITPQPIVKAHSAAWTSMLASLSSLVTPGSEQRLDADLLNWLETSGSYAGSDRLAFGMDVGVLGAGLLPILFEGHGAKARWAVLSRISTRLQEHKPLFELCTHLQNLDSSSFNLTRENLSSSRVGPRKALEAELQRQRDRAANWPNDQILFRNWPNPEYWDMHGAMFDDRHGMHLHKALAQVVRGANDALRKMMPELRKYTEKMPGTLADLRKRTGRKRALEGPHAEKLGQNLLETVKFLEDYLECCSRMDSVSSVLDTPRPLREFLDQLHAKTQAAHVYLQILQNELDRHSQEDEVVRLHTTLAQQILQSTLALMSEQVQQEAVAEDDQILLMDMPLSSSMLPVWSVKLDEDDDTDVSLRDPMLVLDAVSAVQRQIGEARQAKPHQRIEDLLDRAASMHRQNGEILAARAIEQRMRGESAQVLSQIQSANEAAYRRQKAQLVDELTDMRQRVTNALSVGPMTQAEAGRMLKVIEVIDVANRDGRIGAIAPSPAPYEDYPQARAILSHHVLQPLQRRIQDSLHALKSDMNGYRDSLDKSSSDDVNRARKLEQLDRIAASLRDVTPTGIRVARHTFSLLTQDQLPFIRANLDNAAQSYETFQREVGAFSGNRSPLESLRDAMRDESNAKNWPKGSRPSWTAHLSPTQCMEAAEFLDAWIALTEAQSINEVHDPLARFFKAVGLTELPMALSEPGSTGRTLFLMPPKSLVGSARLQGFWMPPILGSAARDLRGMVLRNRPQPELMAQVIDELPVTTPYFVLGRTRLSLSRRSAITQDHPVVIVDDDLVSYMAVNPEQRMAKLMEVGLLTFQNNPYDDYGGPVPPEMFFGRRSELMRLAGNKSALVLYGGRRLGKSSLLDKIQIESRQSLVRNGNEARGEVAIYIPLESRIDSAVFGDDHKLFAWQGIYRGMVNNEFIQPARREPKSADSLREYIRSEIMAKRSLTDACYLLIDEADEVMGRDIDSDGAFATSLRALCDDVRDACHIRYVIAGLHNLTRMHTEGNTALAKADAIALQPFSSGQDILMGVDLITKPLAALGFVFPKGSEDLPLRILAVCNFYPAFVQLYCKNLVQDLYNKRGTKPPTTSIEIEDLDKVERNKDFIGVMQEKFRYNLDLDKRYKAIALVLADTYYRGSGVGVEQGLIASDIRALCHDLFPHHFKSTREGAFTALLDEMEKLTVIDRKGARYQLRTPHIATMLGSSDDVDHKIDELARETPASQRTLGEMRPFLTRSNGHETTPFPMSSGWVRQFLHEEETDLVIVVGNHLSGLSEIENLKQPWSLARDALYEVKYFPGLDSAKPYINSVRRTTANGPTSRIVASPSRAWKPAQIGDFANLASSLARPLITLDERQRTVNVRLMLIANPEQAWEIAKILHPTNTDGRLKDSTQRSASAKRNWRVEAVPAWSDDAIYYRLKQLESQTLPDQPDVCNLVLDATMGFGGEISKLLRPSLTLDGIRQVHTDRKRKIAPNLLTFYEAIGWPSAIGREEVSQAQVLLALLDGEQRSDSVAQVCAKDYDVSIALLTYLRWMGLLQEGNDGTWRVPSMYKALISAPDTSKSSNHERLP